MINDSLKLNSSDMAKVREIFDFLLRGTNREITSIVPHQITLKENKDQTLSYCYNYDSYGMIYVIYKMIPEFLDIGAVTVEIQNYSSLLDIYIDEVNKRLSTEESAEEAPKNLEEYEEATGI